MERISLALCAALGVAGLRMSVESHARPPGAASEMLALVGGSAVVLAGLLSPQVILRSGEERMRAFAAGLALLCVASAGCILLRVPWLCLRHFAQALLAQAGECPTAGSGVTLVASKALGAVDAFCILLRIRDSTCHDDAELSARMPFWLLALNVGLSIASVFTLLHNAKSLAREVLHASPPIVFRGIVWQMANASVLTNLIGIARVGSLGAYGGAPAGVLSVRCLSHLVPLCGGLAVMRPTHRARVERALTRASASVPIAVAISLLIGSSKDAEVGDKLALAAGEFRIVSVDELTLEHFVINSQLPLPRSPHWALGRALLARWHALLAFARTATAAHPASVSKRDGVAAAGVGGAEVADVEDEPHAFRHMSPDSMRRAGSLEPPPSAEAAPAAAPIKSPINSSWPKLAQVTALGDCDAFLSHSWYDDPEPKFAALQAWSDSFCRSHGRAPRVFFDRLCIDQAKIEQSLTFLPIWLAGCDKLLVLRGPTYLTRLWCVLPRVRTPLSGPLASGRERRDNRDKLRERARRARCSSGWISSQTTPPPPLPSCLPLWSALLSPPLRFLTLPPRSALLSLRRSVGPALRPPGLPGAALSLSRPCCARSPSQVHRGAVHVHGHGRDGGAARLCQLWIR
jgi:hypothetical protein